MTPAANIDSWWWRDPAYEDQKTVIAAGWELLRRTHTYRAIWDRYRKAVPKLQKAGQTERLVTYHRLGDLPWNWRALLQGGCDPEKCWAELAEASRHVLNTNAPFLPRQFLPAPSVPMALSLAEYDRRDNSPSRLSEMKWERPPRRRAGKGQLGAIHAEIAGDFEPVTKVMPKRMAFLIIRFDATRGLHGLMDDLRQWLGKLLANGKPEAINAQTRHPQIWERYVQRDASGLAIWRSVPNDIRITPSLLDPGGAYCWIPCYYPARRAISLFYSILVRKRSAWVPSCLQAWGWESIQAGKRARTLFGLTMPRSQIWLGFMLLDKPSAKVPDTAGQAAESAWPGIISGRTCTPFCEILKNS